MGPAVPVLRPDPPYLHLAAAAFAYSILDCTMTYSEAVSAIMRTALRERVLRDCDDDALEGIRDRLETSLNRAIAEVSSQAAEAVRDMTRKLIAQPTRPARAVLQEVAYAVNRMQGDVLPQACVDWMVLDEVRAALGMVRAP